MPTFSVDKVIGTTLVAITDVKGYSGYPKSSKVKTITKGSVIGVVTSWLKDPDNGGNVYWQFKDKYGDTYFYVKHDVNKIKFSPSENLKSVEQEKKDKEEEQKKQDEGVIPYYIEKYAPYIAGTILLGVAIKAGIDAYARKSK